ncbi:MAG: Nif3-like dinuclear metal center hexameric protein [Bacteroidales bacterium]|nr:Nif3-like dinuclear metal center hexameric protein [Bacteroidales bacterium]
MKIRELVSELEHFAPPSLQESYDNAGLNVGFPDAEISGVLLCIDVVPEVVDEAIAKHCNMIVSHHPLIFPNIKRITGSNNVEKSIIKALQNNISIYCGHTNFDKAQNGVSMKMCEKLGLKNCTALDPEGDMLRKIAVFVPKTHADEVRNAMFAAGAGTIGDYDECSFNLNGTGTFRASEACNPFVGEIGERHCEDEVKVEVICPSYLQSKVVSAMLKVHPYEEPAFDIYQIENQWSQVGLGAVGELVEEITEDEFLETVKRTFSVENIRHSAKTGKKIRRVAVCGGSGASFIRTAIASKADAYITADIKYHDWFQVEGRLLLLDIGHFESEQFTKEIFYDVIVKKSINFATYFSDINTNPINNY